MMKWIGSCLILLSCSGIGVLESRKLQEYLESLRGLQHIFLQLKSEISYKKAPLAEAFEEIRANQEGVYGAWLAAVVEQLRGRTGRSFAETWEWTIREYLGNTRLKREDIAQLAAVGNHMGCMDERMQIKSIELYLELLETRIQQVAEGLGDKKKIYHCLGIMAGLFLVVVLV